MWSDKETNIDYLNFGYLVDLITEIASDRELSPSTIGLYGDWGSGKSSLMRLAKDAIENNCKENASTDVSKGLKDTDGKIPPKILCIEFNGWLFEGYEDAKSSLCGTILDSLADEKRFSKEITDKAKELIKKIDYKKLLGKGIKYGMDIAFTGGLGTLTEITLGNLLASLKSSARDLTSEQIEEIISNFKADEKVRNEIKNFRKDFAKLLKESKVENVVVFIDELDRCNPDTILDIFEAMRLFLFVDGMSFVIGADERLIQYAIKTKYKEVPENNLNIGKEYLEKVIQYPVNIPQLNESEVNQYLSCLLLEKTLTKEEFESFLSVIHQMKPGEELTMELLEEKTSAISEKSKDDLALAKQISSVLAPSINGNPRQCKRFLNTLLMRMKLAKARHVELDRNILAKLLMAEYFEPDFFVEITKKKNRDAFKAFESNGEIQDDNPFKKWQDNGWVKTWLKNGPEIKEESLDEYFYFANVNDRYGKYRLEMLSPTARKCYEYLVDGTESHRNEALNMVTALSTGEQNIIAKEVFSVLETSSKMNVEVLRSFADFMAATNMTNQAVSKLMQLPVEKYTQESYGQLTPFMNKLSAEEKKKLDDYLKANSNLAKTIDRTNKAMSIIKGGK